MSAVLRRAACACLYSTALSLTAFAAETPAMPDPDTASETVIATGSKSTGGAFGAKSGTPLDLLPQSIRVLTASDLSKRGFMADQMRAGARQVSLTLSRSF